MSEGRPAGSPYAAVLWDMDGTLVDTEPYWIREEYALAEKYGGTWSEEHALQLVGNDLLESGLYIREHMGIDREPAEIVEELLDGVIAQIAVEVPWRPGAVELLADLRARDVPCALVTMSYRRFVAPDPGRAAGRDVLGRRHRRRRRSRQALPRPLPQGRPAARCRSGRLPGDRGLQHGRALGRGGGLHGAVRAQPRAHPRGRTPRLRRLAAGPERRKPSGRRLTLRKSLPFRDHRRHPRPWTPAPPHG